MRHAAILFCLLAAACAPQPDPFHVERLDHGRYLLTAAPTLADGRASGAFVNARGHRLCKSGHSVLSSDSGVSTDGQPANNWVVACNKGTGQ